MTENNGHAASIAIAGVVLNEILDEATGKDKMTENNHAVSVLIDEILVKATNLHKSSVTITNLPREMMVKILKNFSPKELCRIGLTCRQLNDDTRSGEFSNFAIQLIYVKTIFNQLTGTRHSGRNLG